LNIVGKRRLPVLQAAAHGDSDEPPRPAWQWVGFGAAAIFAAWVPLSALVAAVTSRWLGGAIDGSALRRAALITAVFYASELAAGAVAGGYLVGRWGPAGVGKRQAALGGAAAAAVLVAATWLSSGPSLGMLLVALLTPWMSSVGGSLGLRARR
jgi:hypothetical protein